MLKDMSLMSLQLIVGLGNPDKKLLSTRHNVGFWFLDLLSEKLNKDFGKLAKCEVFLTIGHKKRDLIVVLIVIEIHCCELF